jgi:hypothetical protein
LSWIRRVVPISPILAPAAAPDGRADRNLSSHGAVMNFRQKFLPRFSSALLGLFALSLLIGAAIAAPVEDTEAALRAQLLKHRIDEAATKQRLAEIEMQGERSRTPNQELFDVQYYDLDITLNPSAYNLTGTLEAVVEVVGGAINTLDLHLRTTMNVSSATSGGNPTTYSHLSGVLTIDLDRTYNVGELVTVEVAYSGNPSSSSFGWESHAGEPMIWTLSEPFGARNWWPCKDDNRDKPETMDIRVTVPSDLIVASNGSLISDIDNGNGTRTFHWYSSYPITTYLVSLAIYPYYVYSDWYTPQGGGDPMEVVHYVFPDRYDDVQANYALTVPMIETFVEDYGEYPFLTEKYGHAMFNWGGGMEHQTCSSMSKDWWSEDLISHELAHQWWGDMITCADFGHIWLNEGFATWSEAYWKREDGQLRDLPALHGHRRLLRSRHDLRRGPAERQHLQLEPELQQGLLGRPHAAPRGGRRGLLRRPGPLPRPLRIRQRHHRAAARCL